MFTKLKFNLLVFVFDVVVDGVLRLVVVDGVAPVVGLGALLPEPSGFAGSLVF